MWLPTSGHWSCPGNIFKMANSLALTTRLSHSITPSPQPIVLLSKPAPLIYPLPTSKGDHGRDRVTTSKSAFKQQTPVISKQQQVEFNSKGYHETIASLTISLIAYSPKLNPFNTIQLLDEPFAARTRSSTLLHNYTTPSWSRYLSEKIMTHVS